jgi:hypothetical protein
MSGALQSPSSLRMQTKRGNDIPNRISPERAPAALRAAESIWKARFPDIEVRSLSATYNCIGLVVASRRACADPDDILWILRDDGYRRLGGEAEVQVGDVVIYRDDSGTLRHAGIVIRKELIVSASNDEPLVILSQWGLDGEYTHKMSQVPEIYGKAAEFWTDRRDP